MPLYRYKALNTRGEVLDGQMEAANDAEVVLRLQEQGHLPVEAKLASEGGGESAWRALFKPKPFAGARLVQFTQQLATLLAAGQPLDRSLAILLEMPEDEIAKRTITDIRDAVRGGTALSTALERQHGTFSRLYINMVRAGEAGGSLHETLQRLADYLERSRALQGRLINALIYPAILLIVVGAALLFLMGFVVPQFASMYESLDVELPWFTAIVLGVSLLVRDWWIVLIAIPALAAWRMDRKLRDPAFRTRFDDWLLRRKIAGALVAKWKPRAWLAPSVPCSRMRAVADRAGHRPHRAREPRACRRCRSCRGRRQERRRAVGGAGQGQTFSAAGVADDPGRRGVRRARQSAAENR